MENRKGPQWMCKSQNVTVDGKHKSGDHQLRLVVIQVYPIIYKVFTSQVVQNFFYQQYHINPTGVCDL